MSHNPIRTSPFATRPIRRLPRLFACLAFIGCGSDPAAPQPTPGATALFWALTLDHHAITLSTVSPYDTSRVTATPRDPTGVPLKVSGTLTYQSTDLAHLQLAENGLLQAISPAAGVQVVATLSMGGVTHADTAVVNITTDSAPPVLTTFSIHPVPPDSAIWDANALNAFPGLAGPKVLTLRALDDVGNSVPGLAVDFRSSDSTIATIDPQAGVLTGMRPGQVLVVASATAYGVSKSDTLPFTITMPLVNVVVVAPPNGAILPSTFIFSPNEVTIVAGGTVLWVNGSPHEVDVAFDDSTQVAVDSLICTRFQLWTCGAGNIPLFGGDSTSFFADLQSRAFPTPGAYTFHSNVLGATAKIIVTPHPARTAASAQVSPARIGFGTPAGHQ